ncbi:MAG: hypothetical protein HYX25_09050 [Candidatus Solibacter usitatus]|nr:hypothetical protein [Candidatus Solibacter usitatus]
MPKIIWNWPLAALCLTAFCGMASGQGTDANEPQLSGEVREKIAFGLRWIAYWEPDYITSYKAGETIPIKLVQSPDEVVVFLSKVRLSVTFRSSSGGKLDRLHFIGGLSRIGNETLGFGRSFLPGIAQLRWQTGFPA